MADLNQQLQELSELVEFPATPNLAPAVRARISEAPRERRAAWWPARVVIALAVMLVVIGAAFAVPQARSEILEWLGIGGVTVTRVDATPDSELRGPLRLGPEVTLTEATEGAAFDILVPGPPLGEP